VEGIGVGTQLPQQDRHAQIEGSVHKGSISRNPNFSGNEFLCFASFTSYNFTNMVWQLYIDFYTIRIVFASSFQLCILKVANLKKIWQLWQKCVDRTFVHVKHGAV